MALVPREDRGRLAAGVITGVLTAVIVVAFWFLRSGGGADPNVRDALTAGDTAAERAAGERSAEASTGPIIGAFQQRVESRLRADDPATRPISGPLQVRARQLRWQEPGGARFAEAVSATARVDLGAVRNGDIIVDDVVLNQPDINLRESADGAWNYEIVLAELLDGGDGGSDNGDDRRVIVRGLRVVNGNVDVDRPDDSFRIADLDATLPTIWFADPAYPDPTLRIATATARIEWPDRAPVAVSGSAAEVRLTGGPVAFDIAALEIDGTRLADVTGEWDPDWAFPGLNARGRALGVDFAAIARYAPERIPDEGTATFAWSIEPLDGQRIEVALWDIAAATGGSTVAGSLTVRLGGTGPLELRAADLTLDPLEVSLVERYAGPLPYQGLLRGTVRGTGGDIAFDLVADLAPDGAAADRFETALRGRVALTDAGFALRGLVADFEAVPLSSLRAFVPIPFGGYVSGTVSLTGTPDRTPLALDVRLALGAGTVTASGTVDLTGAVPAYDLQGTIDSLSLMEVLRPRAPPVLLNADFALAGRGFAPESADARVRVAGRFTGWETDASDTVSLVATVSGGTLDVESLRASIASASVSADGRWRFVAPQEGAIRYALEVADLGPWEPYIPGAAGLGAQGRLAATGEVTGELSSPRLEGAVEGEAVAVAGWTFDGIELDYALALNDSLPEVVVSAAARGIVTPTAGSFESASLEGRFVAPDFDLMLRADRANGGAFQVVADGRMPRGGERVLVLRQLDTDVEGGRWTLTGPATLAVTSDGTVRVGDLAMIEASSGGRLTVDGTVWPLGVADVRIETAALPLADVQELLGMRPVISGDLVLTADVRTAAGVPTIDATFSLDSGVVEGVRLAMLRGSVQYADRTLRGRAEAALDATGGVTAEIVLPVVLRLDSMSFDLVEGGEVSGGLAARNLALAPLGAASPFVRDVQGMLDARMTLRGTVEAPDLAGQFQVLQAAVTVVPLDQRFTSIAGDIDLAGRTITVNELVAVSDGRATVRGRITLEDLTDPVADLTVQLANFRPMGVRDREDAAFSGNLSIQGPLAGPSLSGRLAVNDGYIPIPDFGGPPDDFSDLAEIDGAEPSWTDALRVDGLVIDVANDVWFTGAGAQAQLGGEITVNKTGDVVRLQGTLQGERGTYTLEAGPIIRRFQIASARVRFLGTPEINPAIDITAQRVVLDPQGRQLEIQVRVGGTMRSPTLSLASADLATVPESELLSFLFFGRPSADLGTGGIPGEALLEETFVGGFAELAGLELERTLVRDLGLSFDLFQIRFGGPGGIGGFGAPTLVLGWELGSEFFLTVESALGALADAGAGFENSWAIRLEWAFDENSRARIGFEPVSRNRFLRGYSLGLAPVTRNQIVLEVRRRWTY